MAELNLKDRIRQDMNAARRQQDRDRARLLSTLLSDIRNREIEKRHELDEGDVLEVLARGMKMRNEAAEQMASRPELAAKERAEVEIIKGYMPAQLSEEEIRQKIVEAIEAGATNIGPLMGQVMPQLKGRAEGREVNRIAREELARRSGD
ncbi:MAG: GatB/YqeY domain-containing protein [Gemmatimonadota bacterium]|nr:MAG: GatB/YqeY domain-containing protein [Gemmatimonadota bacterium]